MKTVSHNLHTDTSSIRYGLLSCGGSYGEIAECLIAKQAFVSLFFYVFMFVLDKALQPRPAMDGWMFELFIDAQPQ